MRECFCFGCEDVNGSGEAVGGLVKSRVNSRLPKFVGFFELRVHQCTDWLRILKRQSNVNRYILSFQGKRFVFIYKFANGEYGEMHRGSFKFSEYPQVEQKNYTKGRTGESC